MIIEKVNIKLNHQIAENIWEMVFEAPNIASKYVGAGQFVSILANDSWGHPLRRPMSIASVEKNNISIIYKIFGDVKNILSKKNKGDSVELLGPIGNTFSISESNSFPILVGGGVGLAPILNLKHQCEQSNIDHVIIIGSKNSNEQFMRHEPHNNIYLTTDDGSIGEHGTVMKPLENIIKEHKNPYLYACGPEPMMKAIRNYSTDNQISAQLSVESYMGCGVGLCQGCVIHNVSEDLDEHTYHQKYSLVCVDGPVYDAKDIYFE